MKRIIKSNAELIEAINTLLDYNWADEERDFKQHEGDKANHIFATMRALNNWVRGNQ